MGIERLLVKKTPVSLDEIRIRVGHALQRHPMCRDIEYDIVGVARTTRGGNWAVKLHGIEASALWEASDIVADIQAAYELAGYDAVAA